VNNADIDKILQNAAEAPHQVEPVLLERVAESIRPLLRPVRPIAPRWMLTVGVMLISAAISLAGAARAGFVGFEKMGLYERVVIFSALGILACVAATKFVAELIPGSRQRISAAALLGTCCAVLLVVFAVLFRDYRTEHFISAGIACLVVGLLHAVPVALLSWLLLRRGFAVNPVAAGVVAGALAGLAGVAMLELHCPNFEALHILVWHVAVVPVSAGLGGLAGKWLRWR
jgi:hypothetical protein